MGERIANTSAKLGKPINCMLALQDYGMKTQLTEPSLAIGQRSLGRQSGNISSDIHQLLLNKPHVLLEARYPPISPIRVASLDSRDWCLQGTTTSRASGPGCRTRCAIRLTGGEQERRPST
ncbi:hypothetical protein RRG08_016050 [Elysia crispata]|uniref:Uncharacterized protein n=1 Tax=Elysia crispata TaxID=231223 RepID=A0AAE1DJC8_9GAST|nr:hypothetical protein RRG08_016050 [Elysia crispata]